MARSDSRSESHSESHFESQAEQLRRAINEGADAEASRLVAEGVRLERTAPLAWVVVARLPATLQALLDQGLDANTRVQLDVNEVRLHQVTERKTSILRQMRELDAARRATLEAEASWLSRQRLAILEAIDGDPTSRHSLRHVPLLTLATALEAEAIVELLLAAGADRAQIKQAASLAPKVAVGRSSEDSVDGNWQLLEDGGEEEDEGVDWHALPTPPGLSSQEQQHYRRSTVLKRLKAAASSRSFRNLVQEIGGVCNARPTSWEQGEAVDFSFAAGSAGSRFGLAGLQKIAARAKAMAVLSGPEGDRLTLLPTGDLLEAIVAFGIAGPNVDISEGQILAFLKRHRLLVTRLRHDLIVGRLQRPPKDPEAVALELYRLCPDLVDQGLGSVEALISQVRDRAELYLWWD